MSANETPYTDEELDSIRNYVFKNARPPKFVITMERWIRTIDANVLTRKDQ